MSEDQATYDTGVDETPKTEMDFLKEIYQATKHCREMSLMTGTPIAQNSRRTSERALDKAILDYENSKL